MLTLSPTDNAFIHNVIQVEKHSTHHVLNIQVSLLLAFAYWLNVKSMTFSRSKMDQPSVCTSKDLPHRSLPSDTTVETIHNSDSNVYENVDISEGDDVYENEGSDTII